MGYCSICECRTIFYAEGPWLRDQLRCVYCSSIPRWRALIHVLQEQFPDWRKLRVHESSPGGPSSAKLRRECPGYIGSHFYPDIAPGQSRGEFRSENLECQTFDNESLDLVISSDVFEHVLNPAAGFAEVARTLKPGGAHVFTVPWYWWKPTLVRAVPRNGEIIHLQTPDYHGNPIDESGSLVVTEWGHELPDFMFQASGLTTTVFRIRDPRLGLDGKFLEVFVSRKPAELGERSGDLLKQTVALAAGHELAPAETVG